MKVTSNLHKVVYIDKKVGYYLVFSGFMVISVYFVAPLL